jgi:general secretion pathway protein A
MYQGFFGLRELPFDLTPNPRYTFLAARHREALSNLQYGLSSAKALTVLIGEAGTGKTTLLRTALESEACQAIRCVYLNNPVLTRGEFVEMLARRFELPPHAARSKTALLQDLEELLRARRAAGEITALVVDEAQSLSLEILEEVRLLANIETASEKLLPLVLAGQPELAGRLNLPELRQLKQRIALRCEIGPFDLAETAAYIASRIRTAGGDAARLFTREAVLLIHERAGGIPRTINVLCDNALVGGFALERRPVDRQVVLDVCRDFDLPGEGAAAPASPRHQDAADAVPRPAWAADAPGAAGVTASEATASEEEEDQQVRTGRRDLFAGTADRPRFRLFGFPRRQPSSLAGD